ncbi:hypothetical protein HQ529_06325 [Candidatus Woesearchaeota archaeon]|nr:hypothetical protein [Candidatus Woesearchaeota archaeon]
MSITELLKTYHPYRLHESRKYPTWMFDFEHDVAEKHMDRSRWRIRKPKPVKNNSRDMWVEYMFSPEIYKTFGGEIKEISEGGTFAFSRFLGNGYFESDPDFHIHTYRAISLYKDDPEILMGRDGRVYYFVMSNKDYLEFPVKDAKTELKLNDIVEIEYKE